MSNQIEDLWPDISPAAIVTPASILKTQATALSQKTNGLLQGEVRTSANQGALYHQFILVVPALENYRYGLLRIRHTLANVYPVYIDERPEPLRSVLNIPWVEDTAKALKDEGEFREFLRETFASTETKRILENLLAQATS
jgi:hypothetical protein